jgi:hypothetical protein
MMSATYRVSTYDPVDDPIELSVIGANGQASGRLLRYDESVSRECDWSPYAEGLSARQAVATVRHLEGMLYDRNASILVEKE